MIESLEAAGDNTVYTLSDDERAAFEELTYPIREKVVGEVGGEDVLNTMQGM